MIYNIFLLRKGIIQIDHICCQTLSSRLCLGIFSLHFLHFRRYFRFPFVFIVIYIGVLLLRVKQQLPGMSTPDNATEILIKDITDCGQTVHFTLNIPVGYYGHIKLSNVSLFTTRIIHRVVVFVSVSTCMYEQIEHISQDFNAPYKYQ